MNGFDISRVQCPKCGYKFKAVDNGIKEKRTCPECKHVFEA